MGRFLRIANQHAEKIEYYFNHAGSAGFSQAEYHWGELRKQLDGAALSTKGCGDGAMIREIIRDMQAMMDEMKIRETSK